VAHTEHRSKRGQGPEGVDSVSSRRGEAVVGTAVLASRPQWLLHFVQPTFTLPAASTGSDCLVTVRARTPTIAQSQLTLPMHRSRLCVVRWPNPSLTQVEYYA
jgi:hypothetical protein